MPTATPIFFGPEDRALYGAYDEPETSVDRDLGVLICAPCGQEYINAHRGLRQLSLRLAREGFHVLRFDYRGCGDSAGEPLDADIESWTEDVILAADELLDRTGLDRLAIVGLRLGATLALKAAARRRDIHALALWEPLLDGRTHVEDLLQKADRARRRRPGRAAAAVQDGVVGVLGFPLSESLRRSIESMAILPERRPARRVLLLRSDAQPGDGDLVDVLERQGAQVERQDAAPPRFLWEDHDEDQTNILVPVATIERAVDWLVGVSA